MKKIIAMLLALVKVMGLAACGGSSAPAATQAPAAPAATEAPAAAAPAGDKITVTMVAAQYSPKTGDWWADFVTKFNAANEDINLVVDVVS